MQNGYGLAKAHNAKIAINSYMRCMECLAGMQSLEGLAGAVPPSSRPGPAWPSCHLRSREPEGIGTILA